MSYKGHVYNWLESKYLDDKMKLMKPMNIYLCQAKSIEVTCQREGGIGNPKLYIPNNCIEQRNIMIFF